MARTSRKTKTHSKGSCKSPDAPAIRTPSDEDAIRQGCWFDAAAADRVRQFFGFLRHSKGQWAGKPFELLPWQWEDVIRPLFGWRRPDGTRRFRRGYVEIPKKNGKSTLAAGMSLYLLVGDNEPGAEVYTAAADRLQASIIADECFAMVKASPALAARCEIVASQKRMKFLPSNGTYRALSADVRTKEGLNIHGLVFDELHVQANRDMWDTLTYGGASRRQPLLVAITTAGEYDPTSIGWEQHQYAQGILDGTLVDPSFLAVMYAADRDDDWTDPAVWAKANPSLGITIRADDMAESCREAQNEPRKTNSFLRYRLNVWTEALDRWLDAIRWASLAEPITLDSLAGEPCWIGLDLGVTRDLSAMVVVFRCRDGRTRVIPQFWVPRATVKEHEQHHLGKYDAWVSKGHMVMTPGNVMDYDYILRDLAGIMRSHDVRGIGYDPYNATQMALTIQEQLAIVPTQVRFTWRDMNEPSKELERMIVSGEIGHDGNEVMSWCVGNVSVKADDAGNIMPRKGAAARDKIDGVTALICGLAVSMDQTAGVSVYERRNGFLEIG